MGLEYNCGLDLHATLPAGKLNKITDVPGIKVGHVTLKGEGINTGVTVILPHEGNIFRDKVLANAEVLNGFGKSMGLIQIKELGTIETPIVLTNTLSVGTAFTGLCRYMLEQNPEIGVTTGTVNCVVTECNDGYLNDIRGLHVREEDIPAAIEDALSDEGLDFMEGSVGSGSGMCCLGLKGGIGSASRLVSIAGKEYTIGALVMANFGAAGNLVIGGRHYDTRKALKSMEELKDQKDKGSIIMIVATDLPLSERQLGRVLKRCSIALGRVGSYMGNGSGDVALGFTTANRISHGAKDTLLPFTMIDDDDIDKAFVGCVEAVEESIISALYHAESVEGIRGHFRMGLKDFLAMTDCQ